MQQRALDNPKLEILFNTTIAAYIGEARLTGLVLKDTTTGATREVQADGLFMAIGHEPLTQHLKGSGVELDEQGYIKVHDHIYTNIDGVFAAGDVHDTHFRQVSIFRKLIVCNRSQAWILGCIRCWIWLHGCYHRRTMARNKKNVNVPLNTWRAKL